MMTNAGKKPQLGTAQWGWNVDRDEAFRILDAWLETGHRGIDLATNYPINKNPADFRRAEKLVQEYLQAHGLNSLEITMKIGSQNNLRSPEINLEPSFILMMATEYRRLFGENLRGIMIHWDNRSEAPEIRNSLEALGQLQREFGLHPGLSGIKFPDVYHKVNQEFKLEFDIQLKHNLLHSDLQRYQAFLQTSEPQHRFFAYGINAGGLKLEGPYPAGSTFVTRGGNPEQALPLLEKLKTLIPKWNTAFVRPPVRTMNHLGLIFAGLNPHISGPVFGFSSVAQLRETLDFWRNLETFDYADVFTDLQKMTN